MPKKSNKEPIDAPKSYFDTRMELLGITPEINKIGLHQTDLKTGKDVIIDVPIFSQLPEGIKIFVYTIDRYQIRIIPKETIDENGIGKFKDGRWKKDFSIIRLEKPIIKSDGSVMKYKLPKGAGTHPFFNPQLIEKFEKKSSIDTLFLTEGYFKAFKAGICGVDIVGLSSITHMKDKETGKLHPDIIKLIESCNVKKVVWLTDGDALDITQDELKDVKDISTRPKNFFTSVTTFKTLLDGYDNIEKWFFHIDTDNIIAHNPDKYREDVKGIDDLLISLPGKVKEIIADLKTVTAGHYFQKFNISIGTNKVYRHFLLGDVKDFYLFHVERRPELKGVEFVFNGTRYQYNDATNECDVKIPVAAKLYIRVGDDYYKFVSKPNQYKQKEKTFEPRRKTTIIDDHPKGFLKYVQKLEAFVNIPDHMAYQPIVDNCFNVYSPLDFLPDEDECNENDCSTIINFLTHIFGSKKVTYKELGTNEKKEFLMIDLALDYFQILYQNPTQKLPILCLVSQQNNTGKTTFANFLRLLFGANVAIVGNADLSNDFNAHWAYKSIVICDETKIDKQHVVEKIKSLSTAKKIFMNAKGKGQVELDCFIKFILITNNEDNFINASKDDIRYWVIKVPVLTKDNPDILDQLKEEIPSFLSFLNQRKMATEKRNRMWFHPQLLKTDALNKLIDNSQPGVEKEIRHYLREMFLDGQVDVIEMTLQDLQKEIFNNSTKYDGPYLKKIIQERLNVLPFHVYVLESNNIEYKTEAEALESCRSGFPDIPEQELIKKVFRKYKTKRYSYPKRVEEGNIKSIQTIKVDTPLRPYCFNRKDFISVEDEIRDVENFSECAISEIEDIEEDDLPF